MPVLCLCCFLGAFLYKKITHILLCKKLKKRFSYAKDRERSAEELLKEKGYELQEVQKESKLAMWVNGKQFSYRVRPDGFVTKEGKRYLVEIKTGKVATDPKHSATRRQLLEYYHGFDVEGVLLVDAEVEEVHHISFNEKLPLPKEVVRVESSPRAPLIVAFLMGALCAALAVWINFRIRR